MGINANPFVLTPLFFQIFFFKVRAMTNLQKKKKKTKKKRKEKKKDLQSRLL